MDSDSDSPPVSPDGSYDDGRVRLWIGRIQENLAADDAQRVDHALTDLISFAVTYYDDGVSRDSLYFADLLSPGLVQRLRLLFFYPHTNERVARVMESLIPENWMRVADRQFVADLSERIACRPPPHCIIRSATLITRKLVLYGDAHLKTEFLKQNLMQNMSLFVNEFLQELTRIRIADQDADLLTEALTHILWTAGELIPIAEQVWPENSFLLYDILKQFIQFPNDTFVRELLTQMDIHCFDPQSIRYLHRQKTIAFLLLAVKNRPHWHSLTLANPETDILRKVVQIIHSLLQDGPETCKVVLDDIRNTWTMAAFCDFLIKDHQRRDPAVVEVAISMLRFIAGEEIAQMNLLPHIFSFIFTAIGAQSGSSRHLRPGLQNLLPLISSFITPQTASESVIQVVDDGIFHVVRQLLSHFSQDRSAVSHCLQIVANLLLHSDPRVQQTAVSHLLASPQLMQQIAQVDDGDCCRDLSHVILSHCQEQKVGTAAPAADIMHLMDRMRLG